MYIRIKHYNAPRLIITITSMHYRIEYKSEESRAHLLYYKLFSDASIVKSNCGKLMVTDIFLSGDPHFGSLLSKGRINVWKRFQIAFVTTIQIRVLWVSTTFPFSHQRLSKDLRKAKRRDAEAPKSFLRKRWTMSIHIYK